MSRPLPPPGHVVDTFRPDWVGRPDEPPQREDAYLRWALARLDRRFAIMTRTLAFYAGDRRRMEN